MITADDAIRVARALIGTPYSELDCINLIKQVIRTAPGGVPSYTTAGTNSLWNSYDMSAKYRDLTWRGETSSVTASGSATFPSGEGFGNARAGMLAFKRSGENVHHVGLVTGDGTVVHASSAAGQVMETALDSSWQLLAIHRYIEAAGGEAGTEETMETLYQAIVVTQSGALNLRAAPDGSKIGSLPKGTVVDVLAEPEQGWTYVRYGSMMGYVSSAYLERSENAGEDNSIAVSGVTIIDDEGNSFRPAGGWRVLFGSID